MNKLLRLAVLASTGLAGLSLAGSALAAYAPKLSVSTAGQDTTIRLQIAPTDDPTFKVTIYAPVGVRALLSQPTGTTIGQIGEGSLVQAADLGNANIPISGTVKTDDPAKPEYNTSPCAPGRHQAIWLLQLSAAGSSLAPVPMYVDATSGAETAFGSTKLQVCLPPPDVPPGTPGRATFGVRVTDVRFTVSNIFSTAAGTSGELRWTAVFTPYTPGVGRPNAAGSVQAQAIVRSNAALTLRARLLTTSRKVRGKRVVLRSVRLTGSVPGASGARVTLLAGGRSIGQVTTDGSGSFSRTVRITRTTSYQARVSAPAGDVTPPTCTASIPGVATCVSVTTGALSARSAVVRVVVPKAKRRGR